MCGGGGSISINSSILYSNILGFVLHFYAIFEVLSEVMAMWPPPINGTVATSQSQATQKINHI